MYSIILRMPVWKDLFEFMKLAKLWTFKGNGVTARNVSMNIFVQRVTKTTNVF